jgi:hypothetical protein
MIEEFLLVDDHEHAILRKPNVKIVAVGWRQIEGQACGNDFGVA